MDFVDTKCYWLFHSEACNGPIVRWWFAKHAQTHQSVVTHFLALQAFNSNPSVVPNFHPKRALPVSESSEMFNSSILRRSLFPLKKALDHPHEQTWVLYWTKVLPYKQVFFSPPFLSGATLRLILNKYQSQCNFTFKFQLILWLHVALGCVPTAALLFTPDASGPFKHDALLMKAEISMGWFQLTNAWFGLALLAFTDFNFVHSHYPRFILQFNNWSRTGPHVLSKAEPRDKSLCNCWVQLDIYGSSSVLVANLFFLPTVFA